MIVGILFLPLFIVTAGRIVIGRLNMGVRLRVGAGGEARRTPIPCLHR